MAAKERRVRVAGFPQNIDHAPADNFPPYHRNDVFARVSNTHKSQYLCQLGIVVYNVIHSVIRPIVPNCQYPLFQVAVLGIEILSEDAIAHRKAFGEICSEFSQIFLTDHFVG